MKTLEVLDKVLKGKRLKPVTQRHYREALGSLAEYEAEWPVSGVVINEWMASLDGFADSTVKMWFDFVNSAGKYMKMAFKVENPCESAERPNVAKKRRRYFNADELMRIIKACVEVGERLLILTLVDSTCRIGEIGADREGSGGLFGKNIGEAWMDVKGKTGERRYRLDASLCEAVKDLGWRIVSGGTDNHLFLIDLGADFISGKKAERWLGLADITVNKNTVPFDTRKPYIASGLRIGTPAFTTRGMGPAEMEKIAELIDRVLRADEDKEDDAKMAAFTAEMEAVKAEVHALTAKFPLY